MMFLFKTVALINVLCVFVPLMTCTLYNPHVFPDAGPFFEGWYIRVLDPQNNISFAVLFGSVLPGETPNTKDQLAFVGVLKHHGAGNLDSYSAFPDISDIRITTANGDPITRDPDWTSPPDFLWDSGTNGYFMASGNDTEVDFRVGSVHVTIQLGDPLPWGKKGEGPAGLLDALPLPLHWFVYSLASPVIHYTWEDPSTGASHHGNTGWAHQEKNWGGSFPDSWIWTQGLSPDSSRVFVLSYGPVGFGSYLHIPGHLFGYRNYAKDIDVSFTPVNSVRSSREYGCGGKVDIEMTSLTHRVRLEVTASVSSFSDCLFGPMDTGFRPVAVESYSATAVITVEERYYYYLFWKTIDRFTFDNAALEFGGSYVCNHKCM